MRRFDMQVDALHQQRPAGLAQRRQARDAAAAPGARSSRLRFERSGATRHPRVRPARRARARRSGAHGGGIAPRTSKGRLCQCSRMNSSGDSPASSGRCEPQIHGSHCAIIDRSSACRSACRASSASPGDSEDTQGNLIDELDGAGRVLLRRRRSVPIGRGRAARPGSRLHDEAAARTRAGLRPVRRRSGVLRGSRACSPITSRPACSSTVCPRAARRRACRSMRSTRSPRSTRATWCSTATIRWRASRCGCTLKVQDVRAATDEEIENRSVGNSRSPCSATAPPGSRMH